MDFSNNRIRVTILILFLLMSSLTVSKEPTKNTFEQNATLINILANPDVFSNSNVNVVGYLSKYMKLHLTKELAKFGASSDGIKIQDITRQGLLINSTCLGRYVELNGKLKKSKDMFGSFYITDVSQVLAFDKKDELIPCYLNKKTLGEHNKFQTKRNRIKAELDEKTKADNGQ